MIAIVSGIQISTVVPLVGRLLNSIEPSILSMFVRTTSIPTPRPDKSPARSTVEKPGVRIKR